MKKYLLFFTLFLISIAGYSSDLQYIKNINDFNCHIQAHKKRVTLLGMYLVNLYPSFEKETIKQLKVETFLNLHDNSKLDVQNQTELYSFYGIDFNEKKKSQFFWDTIDKINEIDKELREGFFDKSNRILIEKRKFLSNKNPPYNNYIKNFFYMIEEIADLVDRGLDPVASEEFGKTMIPLSTYSFSDEINKIAKAKILEKNYDKIISGNRYIDLCLQ